MYQLCIAACTNTLLLLHLFAVRPDILGLIHNDHGLFSTCVQFRHRVSTCTSMTIPCDDCMMQKKVNN